MKVVDKLLLVLLIGLLPLGVVIAQWIGKNYVQETESSSTMDIEKIESVIKQSVAQNQPKPEVNPPFTITSVTYASESGIFKVMGKAPSPHGSILVTIGKFSLNSKQSPTPSPKQTPLNSGIPVETYSILPDTSSGSFTYEYPITAKEIESIIEIRLQQNESSKTIRFNLVEKKQVL